MLKESIGHDDFEAPFDSAFSMSKELLFIKKAHIGAVLDFKTYDDYIVSCGEDCYTHLWKYSNFQLCLTIRNDHPLPIYYNLDLEENKQKQLL